LSEVSESYRGLAGSVTKLAEGQHDRRTNAANAASLSARARCKLRKIDSREGAESTMTEGQRAKFGEWPPPHPRG
jgi:hypothetical protein